jgi:squalene-hopene/tetraprenyl-beta-curcumene cyclase
MAKALTAYGGETLAIEGVGPVAWRPALVRKLVSLQRIDAKTGLGYWQNDNNRWWENDPNLSTSYTLLALETAVFDRGEGTDTG